MNKTLNAVNFEQIYSEMIAGSVPNHSGDVQQTIYLQARDILGTDKIHLHTSISNDGLFAFFLAAPSSVFASVTEFWTPLAAAFPGNENHQGDGIYTITNGTMSVAIIKDGQKFQLLSNDTKSISSLIADLELPEWPVDEFEPELMQSITGRTRFLADQFSVKVIKWCTFASVAAALIGVGANITQAAFLSEITNSNEKSAQDLSALVSKIEYVSPLSVQLANLQRISATVVRAGGWINSYDLKDKKEKFVVSLPEWVTQDFIAALGSGVVANRDPEKNIIQVEKK